MSELIEATAFISATPGRVEELRERLRAVVARTVEEPGCLEFRVFELTDRPGHFVLWETFADEKYGHYYRNLHGIIEHTHYHLGQIVLIKKLLQQQAETTSAVDRRYCARRRYSHFKKWTVL